MSQRENKRNRSLHCPDNHKLQRLMVGDLSLSLEAEWLEQHLLECEKCSRIAAELPSEDEFVIACSQCTDGELEEPAELADLMAFVKRGEEAIDTGKLSLTHGATSTQEINLNFLPPSDNPQDLGLLGGYRILEVLGVGGMGIVFRAEDPILNRQVALKVMKPSLTVAESVRTRFMNEARAIAAIEHENVVKIHQVGEGNDLPFFTMQLLQGESLNSRLKRDGKISPAQAIHIARQTAAGLAAAHEAGLIHRDIKPDNIWLEAETDRCKVLDFGLVRQSHDESLTQFGVVLGTPRYMSPEQANGESVAPSSDLFSLGCLMYRMISGKHPFDGKNVPSVLMAIVHKEAKPVQDFVHDIDPRLARIIHQLLSKNAANRPSAKELVTALDFSPEASGSGAKSNYWTKWIYGGFAAFFLFLGLIITIKFKNGDSLKIEIDDKKALAGLKLDTSNMPQIDSISVESLSDGSETNTSAPGKRRGKPAEEAAADWVISVNGTVRRRNELGEVIPGNKARGLPVVEVELIGSEIENEDLRNLHGLDSIKILSLGATQITEEGFQHLAATKSLSEISISQITLTERGVDLLAQLPELKRITLNDSSVELSACRAFKKLGNLELLHLHCNGLTDDCLLEIASIPKLTQLRVENSGEISPKGFGCVAGMPNLSYLWLHKFTGFKNSNTPDLSQSGITYLDLYDLTLTGEQVKVIAELPRLQRLVMTSVIVTEDAIQPLKELPKMDRIVFVGCNLTQAQAAEIKSAQPDSVKVVDSLEENLANNRFIARWVLSLGGELGFTGIPELATEVPEGASPVCHIAIDGKTNLNDSYAVRISKIPDLKHLRFTAGTSLTDAGLQKLIAIPSLNEIVWYLPKPLVYSAQSINKFSVCRANSVALHYPNLDAAGLAAIARNEHIKSLELEIPKITDEDLRPLVDMPNLRELSLLAAFRITGIQHLRKMKRLRELRILDSNLTAEQLSELKSSLPDCNLSLTVHGRN